MSAVSRLLACYGLTLLLTACTAEHDTNEAVTGVEGRGTDTDYWWRDLPRPEWADFELVDTGQGWFEAYRIAPDVYAIYEPGQYEEVISFLFAGTDRAMLFDSGLGIGNIRDVVSQLTDLDVIVVNSHTHYDHVGGNHLFDRIYARDLEYTGNSARGTPHEAMAEWVSEGWVWKPYPAGFEPGNYASQPFTVTDILNEGDVIDIGGRRFEVLLTPGHAPDSVCLLDRENRILLTGDTFYLAPLYTHIEGSSYADYAASAKRLEALADDVDALYTSHNVPIADSVYLLRMANAFRAIDSGEAAFELTDGNREFFFEGFSIIVAGDGSPALAGNDINKD
jgi:glyoxylase-like metal-dependent hydrolase (beta-lactamase superfamily II)